MTGYMILLFCDFAYVRDICCVYHLEGLSNVSVVAMSGVYKTHT